MVTLFILVKTLVTTRIQEHMEEWMQAIKEDIRWTSHRTANTFSHNHSLSLSLNLSHTACRIPIPQTRALAIITISIILAIILTNDLKNNTYDMIVIYFIFWNYFT
jgi:hypothetical protein